jgi:hypothetical protein
LPTSDEAAAAVSPANAVDPGGRTDLQPQISDDLALELALVASSSTGVGCDASVSSDEVSAISLDRAVPASVLWLEQGVSEMGVTCEHTELQHEMRETEVSCDSAGLQQGTCEMDVNCSTEAPDKRKVGSKWRIARHRSKLISEVFHSCDSDRDGWLQAEEMQAFATHTGFDGDAAEWALEYQVLCEDRKCDANKGFDCSMFIELLNDQSDVGLFCADEELQEVALKLKQLQCLA